MPATFHSRHIAHRAHIVRIRQHVSTAPNRHLLLLQLRSPDRVAPIRSNPLIGRLCARAIIIIIIIRSVDNAHPSEQKAASCAHVSFAVWHICRSHTHTHTFSHRPTTTSPSMRAHTQNHVATRGQRKRTDSKSSSSDDTPTHQLTPTQQHVHLSARSCILSMHISHHHYAVVG